MRACDVIRVVVAARLQVLDASVGIEVDMGKLAQMGQKLPALKSLQIINLASLQIINLQDPSSHSNGLRCGWRPQRSRRPRSASPFGDKFNCSANLNLSFILILLVI